MGAFNFVDRNWNWFEDFKCGLNTYTRQKSIAITRAVQIYSGLIRFAIRKKTNDQQWKQYCKFANPVLQLGINLASSNIKLDLVYLHNGQWCWYTKYRNEVRSEKKEKRFTFIHMVSWDKDTEHTENNFNIQTEFKLPFCYFFPACVEIVE